MKIGLIGTGHFGQALATRFHESGYYGELLLSEGRGKNAALAESCDILILTVRPLQLAALAAELREPLQARGEAVQVICFAAATPLDSLEKALGHRAVRAMADLQLEQVLAFSHHLTDPLLKALSKNPLLKVKDESALEDYTILIACLAGVAAWQKVHRPDEAAAWLQSYARFIHQESGVPIELLDRILEQAKRDPEPEATMHRMATPGGITESLLTQLHNKATSSPEEMREAGRLRTQMLRDAVAASFVA